MASRRPSSLSWKQHVLLWVVVLAAFAMTACAELADKDFFRLDVPIRDASQLSVGLYPMEHSSFRLSPQTMMRQTDTTPRFARGPTLTSTHIAIVDGYATESVYFIFTPDPGKTAADYTFAMESSNGRVCTPQDFTVDRVQTIAGGYNITGSIDFDKWVGQTDLRFTATEKTSKNITVSSQQTCTVYGISCYRTELNGTQTLVSGPNYPLNLTAEEVRNETKVNLACFLQYGDGTDSSESFNAQYPLDKIAISDSGVEKQITHNSAICPDSGNMFNGSTVLLWAGCAYGMSGNDVNGTHVGPQFGLDLNRNRNGTFDLTFDWPAVLAGSPLGSIGYEMILTVNIDGECFPIVSDITPTGPFGSLGTDTVDLVVDNLPTELNVTKTWGYDLSIQFPDGSQRSATLLADGVQTNANKTATLSFELPRGTGANLPWTLNVTKPSTKVLPADDQTEPPYLFTLENLVRLGLITPTSGPESGGINVTLSGEFPLFDPSNSGVFFDGTILPGTSINGFDENTINFTLPRKIGQNFNVSVTVQVEGRPSNALQFSYIPSTKLETMSPSYGPTTGNTTVTLTGQFIGYDVNDANNSGILFGDKQVEASQIISVNDTTLVFSTYPKILLGNDNVYAYNVSVKIGDEVSAPLTFTYQAPISISSISPSSGPESGGTQVTLTGEFSTFTKDSGAVYIGGQKLNATSILSSSATEIAFRTPPRSEVGSAYSYNVNVVALEVQSNSVRFTYGSTSAGLRIEASGGNFDESSGKYFIGACGNTDFRAYLSPGARSQNPLFNWTLVHASTRVSILEGTGVVTNEELLLLPYDIFPSKNTDYELSITISTDFISAETRTLILMQRDVQSIGVRIIDPRPRSISDPNITLTIPSVISQPGCTNTNLKVSNTSMTFIWEFQSKSYLFSYLNNSSPEGQVGPTLLGREFQIPQSAMSYGTFPLRLTAYFTEYTTIRGTDVSRLVVQPAPLVAQINGGESSQFVSEVENFAMSAARSRDPDVLTGDDSVGLTYEWHCMHSTDPTFATNTTCSDALLPSISSVSFTVSSAGLSLIRSSTDVTYVQYSLFVNKFSEDTQGNTIPRTSRTVKTVLILSRLVSQRYDALENIFIRNNLTTEVDRSAVKYFEDVIITPVSRTEDTIWEFQIVEPLYQASLLSDPNNLIPFAGFFSFGLRAGRYSLGILANKLTPNTRYTFRILTYRTGYERNEQTVTFRTVEEPVVTIRSLPRTSGSTNTTFYVAAATNYDSDFKYYIIVTDEYGFEYCVDGCQGVNVARFRLASKGNYRVRCEVYDSLGYTMLASKISATNITVVPPAVPFTASERALQSEIAFEAGDHALYQQLGNDFVKNIVEERNRTSDVELDSAIVTNITLKLAHIVANSVPNTLQSSSFVRSATFIARLSPTLGINLNTSTLYQLLNITDLAVERTPNNAALQQLTDILKFYALAPSLILQNFNAASELIYTNRQLAGANVISRKEMIIILADCFELMKKQVTLVAMKNALCGARLAVKTGVITPGRARIAPYDSDGLPNVLRAQERVNVSINPTQELLIPSSFQVAKLCNPEQGLELFLNEDTNEEIRFKTCSGIFKNRFRNLVFALSNTPDYVWMSKVRNLETRIRGIVSVTVSEVTAGNRLVEDPYDEANCYEVELPLRTEGNMSKLVSRENAVVPAVRFAPPRVFGDPVENIEQYYLSKTAGVSAITTRKTLPDGEKSTIRAKILASNTGIFAVRAIDVGSLFSLEGIRWTLFMILGILLITIVLVGIVGLAAWRYTAAAAVVPIEGVPVDTDFTYVERDIYGRGTAVDMLDPQDDVVSPGTGAAGAAAGAAAAAAAAAAAEAPAAAASNVDSAPETMQAGAEEEEITKVEDEIGAESPTVDGR